MCAGIDNICHNLATKRANCPYPARNSCAPVRPAAAGFDRKRLISLLYFTVPQRAGATIVPSLRFHILIRCHLDDNNSPETCALPAPAAPEDGPPEGPAALLGAGFYECPQPVPMDSANVLVNNARRSCQPGWSVPQTTSSVRHVPRSRVPRSRRCP